MTESIKKLTASLRKPEFKLRLKLDCLLLLWTFIAGLMKEMDQSATTQAYVSGMQEDLNLLGNELVWFQTYFSIAYALCIVPAQLIQTKVRPSLFLPACEISWGILTLFTYRARSATTIYILRFFLGMFSATSWPGIVALIYNWYTPKELALRIALFNVSDVAGAMFLGVVQAELYRHLNGAHGLAGWQWLFIVSGSMTILLGLIGFLIVPDSPSNTRALWLSHEERVLARERMAESGTDTARIIPWTVLRAKLRQLLTHPILYLFIAAFALYAWSNRANAYFLLYLKSVTDTSGNKLYSTYQVNVIPLGGYAFTIVMSIICTVLSDWKQRRWEIYLAIVSVHIVSCSVLSAWPSSHPVIMTFYFLTFATSAAFPIFVAWLGDIFRKEAEARAIAVGLSVTIVYVGHATIPLRAWRVSDSPRYPIGFPLAAAFMASSIIIALAIVWYIRKYPRIVEVGFGVERDDAETGEENLEYVDEKDEQKAG